MTRNSRSPDRERLRHYLLGTLGEGARSEVEAQVESDPLWATALEEERQALSALDSLKRSAPPQGLAESVIEAVGRRSRSRQRWLLITVPAVAMAALVAVLGISMLRGLYRSELQHQSANNLKQLGLVFKMYANESSGGKYPPMAPYEDVWMFDVALLHPEYIPDLTLLVSPRLPDYRALREEMETLQASKPIDWERVTRLAARSLTYLGWALEDPEEIPRLAEERYRMAKAEYDSDIKRDDTSFYRLREGIERFFITDINNAAASSTSQSKIMVLFEPPDDRVWESRSAGSNVLYMDGHVEWKSAEAYFMPVDALKKALTPPKR